MDTMTINYYYYFVTHLFGRVTIEKFITPMLILGYEELTDEQREFYLANQTASVEEIRKCELNPPYVPPAPSIVQLQDEAKGQLKDKYIAVMDRYTDLQVAMAVTSHLALTTLTIADKCPYTLKEANNIIEGFNSLAKDAKSIYDRYHALLGEQMTEEAINATLADGKKELEALNE